MKQLIATALITALTATTAMATDHWATDGLCGINDGPELEDTIVLIVHGESIDTARNADLNGYEWGCQLTNMGSTNMSTRFRAECAEEGEDFNTFVEFMYNDLGELFAYEGDFDGAVRTVIRMQPCN